MSPRQRVIRNISLARIPILWLLLMLALGPIAVLTPHGPVGGIFDIDTYWGLLFVSTTALLVSFSGIVAINLIIEHGPERFDITGATPRAVAFRPSLIIFFLGITPGIIVTGCAAWMSPGYAVTSRVALCLGGLVLAVALLIGAQLLQFMIADPNERRPNYLVFPFDRTPGIGRLLDAAHCSSGGPLTRAAQQVSTAIEWLLLPRFQQLLPGYLKETQGALHLTPGHQFAAVLALTGTLLWFFIGWGKETSIGPTAPAVPTLAYALLALLMLGMVFSALAFFLDRWRIPLLFSLLLWTMVQGSCQWTDHYYDVAERDTGDLPAPALVFTRKGPIPIIVVASGGGIHAGAWTARVIEGLEDACAHHQPTPCTVLDKVALFSSISGGSMATLYLGASLYQKDNRSNQQTTLAEITKRSTASSLDDIAWGLVYPDLLHTFWPFKQDRLADRGWALEQTWAERSNTKSIHLSDWTTKTKDTNGDFPAFIFNATIVEQGRPLAMTTTAFTKNPRAQTRKLASFQDLYSARGDLHVATAARLSATFPFVTPAARSTYNHPAQEKAALHIVDGGYYDNFGVLSALDWLDEALRTRETNSTIKKVAIVEIRLNADGTEELGNEHGWPYQLYAPLSAIVSVRNHEQLREDHARRDLFADVISTTTTLAPFEFVYSAAATGECAAIPLSWKLREAEKKCIDATWSQALTRPDSSLKKNLDDLIAFLRPSVN